MFLKMLATAVRPLMITFNLEPMDGKLCSQLRYVSGLHRISGCVMAGALLVGSVGFAVLPLDFTTFVSFVKRLELAHFFAFSQQLSASS